MSLRIRFAEPDDVESIAHVAASAFSPDTDALGKNLFPARLKPDGVDAALTSIPWRIQRKRWWQQAQHGVMMVAVDDALGGQVVGFSLWEKPAVPGQPTPVEPKVTCPGFDEDEYKYLKKTTNEAHEQMFGPSGLSTMWNLDYLAVDPAHQRRGIGRMLIEWGLQESASLNQDVYLLATPAGKPAYDKIGFNVVGVIDLWGVPHHSMVKKCS